MKRPFLLLILDGWGYREEVEANAIAQANKPNWDHLCQNYAHTLISGSGHCVGLPSGQMGNSEVGHLNIGAGRIVHQDLTRINLDIRNGDFYKIPNLLETLRQTKSKQKSLHLLGLLSPGGVHSHESHIMAMVNLAIQHDIDHIYIHAFLDGRDTPPKSAQSSLEKLIQCCQKDPRCHIASIVGRYYAMDRDKRWDRIEKTYNLLTAEQVPFVAPDALTALQMAYNRMETDEFVQPTRILLNDGENPVIKTGDTVIFMNFRADRARELTDALTNPDFHAFKRQIFNPIQFVSLTEYDPEFHFPVIYPSEKLEQILGAYLSQLGLRQLRIAETEKYAHITFFFNGGVEMPYPGEDRVLIPSPKVATYDLKPEMSAPEVTAKLIEKIETEHYDVIVCNFANPDMVGHTGNLPATIKAIEIIDNCLGKIIATLQRQGGEALITADHGNAEQMFNHETGQPHTAHTSELVPLIYVGRKAKIVKKNGILSDIAPSLLYLMDIPKPKEMTGQPIFSIDRDESNENRNN